MSNTSSLDVVSSLCKRRGFIFHSSEVYGGINGFWDYGPMGCEMKRNITALGRETSVRAVHAPSEKALDHITPDALIIVDPPRAGLHADVIAKLLETRPERILYLSCNPVTQARDVALLGEIYGVRAHRGYNFFPRTPHIEHLVILDRKP